MEKETADNLQNSPDRKALNIEEIIKNNVEKDSCVDEQSPVRVEPDSLIISVESNSESMRYTVSSDSTELSYLDCVEWPPLTIVPFSFIETEDFKEADEETMPIEHRPFKMVGVGMCNLGNTCFLNAVVQCFMHTVVLLQLLASIDHFVPLYQLCTLYIFVLLNVGKSSNFSPSFHPNQQEDAHEFLQCFLNKLESCCYNLEPQDNIVKEAFGGRLVSMLRCCNCCHLSVTHEPPIDLSLEIMDVDSVPEALESFTKIEKIEFSCEMCKTQGPFEKQLIIDRASSVTTLCLKRFKNDGFAVQKVDNHVSFPLELDMLHYTNKINNEEMKYDLYAVIVHSGFSISSGHYHSFIHCNPNKWYKFNDEQVHWVHQDLVLTNPQTLHKSGYPLTSSCIPNNHASNVGESNHAADDTSPKPTPNKRIKGDC
ncbi:hypothetical protein H5410_036501 [Solanum commersonii]|uniref:Ubiquitin carboxyl-terminal hydrolase n=1 Tax=Solanum commersonii TaxID=4109 RepID=A0A9J5Y503_SOLCO|nr:hypothetical protein H5410_036501 [Solanum commersonii]